MSSVSKQFCTLSFSGAGHLLSYHLGVAHRLLRTSKAEGNGSLDIRAAAGSSSGAIAAAVMTIIPHRIDEYADRFHQDRGYALRNLRSMLAEEALEKGTHNIENQIGNSQTEAGSYPDSKTMNAPGSLSVCTTASDDGSIRLFAFEKSEILQPGKTDDLIRAIQASCSIPKSFHPYDIISKGSLSYPDGVEINGALYVDGGIACAAPPTIMDKEPDCSHRIVISPISGSPNGGRLQIRPDDTSFALPGQLTTRCGTFHIRPSVQNLRSLITSIGVASPELLQDWYKRGCDDADAFLERL